MKCHINPLIGCLEMKKYIEIINYIIAKYINNICVYNYTIFSYTFLIAYIYMQNVYFN